jgi:hypothetical protein
MMRQRHTGPWIAAGSLFLFLALIATGELLVLTGHAGTHILLSRSSLNALFHIWQ